MSRRPRKNMKTSFFHIVVKGIQGNYIFNAKDDAEKYIKLIEEEHEGIIILAYCIMNNHAHILIHVNDINSMEKWMHRINTKYAKYYNAKHEKIGYVFNNRYYTQEIANEKHLYGCVKYIHNNPVKAKICDTPDKYAYSSFKNYYRCNMTNVSNMLREVLNLDVTEEEFESLFQKYDIVFIDDDEAIENECNEFFNELKREYGIEIQDLKKNEILVEVVRILKTKFNFSYREMQEKLGLGREKLRNIVKKNESKW